jgi:phospholipid-binding lipoprotein MlaA
MPLNRFVFRFNDVVGRYALVPLGKGYARVVPDAVDRRVENFFSNAASPIYAVNNLLQAEPRLSGRNLARFGINTTVGLLGLFDPAEAWFGLERAEADFATTLAHHDIGYGIYLVLPFFGASDGRNAAARVVDYFLHPIPWVLDQPESFVLMSYGFFHEFAQGAEAYERLLEQSEDPYIFMRNLHLQSVQRDAAYR